MNRDLRLLILVLFVLSLFPSLAGGQTESDLPEELGTALGLYKPNVSTQNLMGFEDFGFLRLMKFPGQDLENPHVNKDGSVFVDGMVSTTDGKLYRFRRATLKRRPTGEYEQIEFKTVSLNGIAYGFRGRFLENSVQEKKGGNYTEIKGLLIRYANGKIVASAILPFYEHATL